MIKRAITAIVDEVPLYGCPATITLRNQLHSDSTLNYGEIWKVVKVIEGLRKSLREEPLSASDIDFIVRIRTLVPDRCSARFSGQWGRLA